MTVSRTLIEGLKGYAKTIPHVQELYPEALGVVLDALEEAGVPPAVWVPVGQAISDEGAYRMLSTISDEVIDVATRNKL